MNFDDRSEEFEQKIMASVRPAIKGLLAKRDKLAEKLVALEAQAADLQGQKAEVEQAIEGVKAQGVEAGLAGGNPLKGAGRLSVLRGKIEMLSGLLAKLADEIEVVKVQGSAAQVELYEAYMGALREFHEKIKADFEAAHLALSQMHVSYSLGQKRLFQKVMAEAQFAQFPFTHAHSLGQRGWYRLVLPREGRTFSIYELARNENMVI
jgi:predicted  nucleic acid-binding Zn-ribbon protein